MDEINNLKKNNDLKQKIIDKYESNNEKILDMIINQKLLIEKMKNKNEK